MVLLLRNPNRSCDYCCESKEKRESAERCGGKERAALGVKKELRSIKLLLFDN